MQNQVKLEIKNNKGKLLKTYKTDKIRIKFGTVDDLIGIYEDVLENNIMAALKKRHMIVDLIKEIFPDITEEHIREIDVIQLITEIAPQIMVLLGETMGNQLKR